MLPNITLHKINQKSPLSEAMALLSQPGHLRTIFTTNDSEQIIGTLTDGDIRRGLMKSLNTADPVEKFHNTNFSFISEGSDSLVELSKYRKLGITAIPILDSNKKLKRVINLATTRGFAPVTAVIMAGGQGVRLRPLTAETPKPMLKIGETPLIEINIKKLISFGIEDVYIAVNYKKEQIMNHFKDGSDFGIRIHYLEEETPLGTAGALTLLPESISKSDILMFNADLLSDIDLEEMYLHYKNSNADMCIGSIPYKVQIPFAVLDLKEDQILGLNEKPTYTYYSNGGFYLFNKSVINTIPYNTNFNATDLAENIINKNGNVIQFPIIGYWSDIGTPEDFLKAQTDIKHFNL